MIDLQQCAIFLETARCSSKILLRVHPASIVASARVRAVDLQPYTRTTRERAQVVEAGGWWRMQNSFLDDS